MQNHDDGAGAGFVTGLVGPHLRCLLSVMGGMGLRAVRLIFNSSNREKWDGTEAVKPKVIAILGGQLGDLRLA